MMVSVNRAWGWTLGFIDLNKRWNLTPHTTLPLSIRFDGAAPWNGNGTVSDPNFVVVPMADNSRLINDFRKGLRMEVLANGQTFFFDLNGTSRLMVDLADCVGTRLAIERGDPLPVRQARPAPPPAPPPPAAQREVVAPTPPRNDELEATRIATNLLLQAQMPGARLLSRNDAPEGIRSRGVAWRSDIGWGAVFIDFTAGSTAQEVAATILADDGKGCRGEHASARSSEAVDGQLVTRASSACRDSSGAITITYIVVPRRAGGHVIFALAPSSTGGNTQASDDREQQSAFQRAALRVVALE